VRHLRAGAEAAKSSSSFYESYSGHFVSQSLDSISDLSRLPDSVRYAQDYWSSRGGVGGAVGGALAWTGGLIASPATSTARLFDYQASDAERTGALVEVGLMLATLGAARAGVGSLAGRWASREVGALGRTRAGAALGTALAPAAQLAGRAAGASARVLTSPIDDLARGAGAFTLRQGTRAADAIAASPAGRAAFGEGRSQHARGNRRHRQVREHRVLNRGSCEGPCAGPLPRAGPPGPLPEAERAT
jgi:hypothetical protein